jgi:hypothetical protein
LVEIRWSSPAGLRNGKPALFAGLDPAILFIEIFAVASAGDNDRRANQ